LREGTRVSRSPKEGGRGGEKSVNFPVPVGGGEGRGGGKENVPCQAGGKDPLPYYIGKEGGKERKSPPCGVTEGEGGGKKRDWSCPSGESDKKGRGEEKKKGS